MEAEYRAAVAWWCDALRGNARDDNGDADTWVIKSWVKSMALGLTEVQIETFGNCLLGVLLDPEIDGFQKKTLSCDYHPDALLAKAAAFARIEDPMIHFPMKTVMWIEPGRVTVQNGYGAEVEVIYPAQEGGA